MGRSPCCEKIGLKRGKWTEEEDQKLISYIKANGEGSWRSLPKNAGLLRCGKSCRMRWINYLRDDLKRGNFTTEEEETIVKLHKELGNRWSVIATNLPGRTDNEIKNYWKSHLSRTIYRFRSIAGALPSSAETKAKKVTTSVRRIKNGSNNVVKKQSSTEGIASKNHCCADEVKGKFEGEVGNSLIVPCNKGGVEEGGRLQHGSGLLHSDEEAETRDLVLSPSPVYLGMNGDVRWDYCNGFGEEEFNFWNDEKDVSIWPWNK